VSSYAAKVRVRQDQRKPTQLSEADRETLARAASDLRSAMPSPGLKVGDRAPDFTLPNAFGQPVTLSKQLAKGPVVLVFYRGAWCPYCNLHLASMQESLPAVAKYGASLVAVSPQKPGRSAEQIRKHGYAFEVLSDLEGTVMNAYQVRFSVPSSLSDVYVRNFRLDLAEYNGPGRYDLPVPGTFVIDRTGRIRSAQAHTDYKRRMEPADVLAALKQIRAQEQASASQPGLASPDR
jgi:peroxiredoxin